MHLNGENNEVSILIIDDDQDIRDVFREILLRKGYSNIECVGTGDEAVEILSSQFINIAIIDLNLPDINGIDLILKLRSIGPDTEFVIITGYGSIDSAVRALEFDVSAYLEKPISSTKLIRTLEDVLERQKLKLENQQFTKDLEHANTQILFLNNLLVNNVDELNQSLLLTMVQIEKLNPSPEQKKILQLFQKTIRKNARLTRNIKKLNTIQEKQSTQQFKEIELEQVMRKVINRVQNDYRDKNFTIETDWCEENVVFADENIFHLFYEILLTAILNDPNPNIRIKLQTEKKVQNDVNMLQININAFLSKIIYEQRNVHHPTELSISPNDKSFQDLGPFVVNSLVRMYHGEVNIPEENQSSNNFLQIYLPCEPTKKTRL